MGCDIKNPPVCFLYQYTGGMSDWIDTWLLGAYDTLLLGGYTFFQKNTPTDKWVR